VAGSVRMIVPPFPLGIDQVFTVFWLHWYNSDCDFVHSESVESATCLLRIAAGEMIPFTFSSVGGSSQTFADALLERGVVHAGALP
jgi:hypothetical protein